MQNLEQDKIQNLLFFCFSILIVTVSWQDAGNLYGMEILSDGSIVCCTSMNSSDTNWSLVRYSITGEVMHKTELQHWAGGLAEVTLGGEKCLAVSFLDKSSDAVSYQHTLDLQNHAHTSALHRYYTRYGRAAPFQYATREATPPYQYETSMGR